MRSPTIVITALLITVFALVTLPDEFYHSDLVLHIPFIKRQTNQHLYQLDYLWTSINPQASSAYYFLGTAVSSLPMSLTVSFRLLWGLGLFLLFWALLRFSIVFSKNLMAGIFWVLLLLLHLPVGGTAIHTVETTAIPRFLGIVAGSWCLVWLLGQRWRRALSAFVITFLLHPLTAFFLGCLLSVYYQYHRPSQHRKQSVSIIIVGCLLIFGGLTIPIMAWDWLEILKSRTSYAFIDQWQGAHWLLLLLELTPGLMYLSKKDKHHKPVMRLFLATLVFAGISTLMHIIFVIIHPLPLIVGLQLGRSWWWAVAASFLCLGDFLAKKRRTLPIVLTLLIAIVVWRNTISPYSKANASWLDIEHLVRGQTEINCQFLVPFYSVGFRIDSERASVGEYKDGALSLYSADFAREWSRRLTELGSWQALTDVEIATLRQRYRFEYIVDETRYPRREFPIIYENEDFRVYQLATCNV